MRPLDSPIPMENGKTINETVSAIIWSGGNLTDNFFEGFGVNFRLPTMQDGEKLYFPVSQHGPLGWLNWTSIPGSSGDASHPAPAITFFSNGTSAQWNSTLAKQSNDAFLLDQGIWTPLCIFIAWLFL